jgi:hypothetical protein
VGRGGASLLFSSGRRFRLSQSSTPQLLVGLLFSVSPSPPIYYVWHNIYDFKEKK